MIKYVLLITNRKSSKNIENLKAKIIKENLEKNNVIVICRDFILTSGNLADNLFDDINTFDVIIVVGGDGTANFVANCIARNNYKVLLAVYPGGTCNTFCLSANIVTDSNRFSDLIIRNKVKKIDLIRFNNKYILNGFTFGFSMTCMDQDNLQIKREYPKLAYPYLVFRKYLFSNKLNFTSIWEIGDSSGIECNTAFITITNGSWHAGIEDFSVGGSYQDGLFRVMFIPGDKAKIIKFCNSLIIKRNREHISAPGVKYFSARFLELKLSDEDIPCSIDGEYCQFPGQTNYTFEICPSKLSIIDFD